MFVYDNAKEAADAASLSKQSVDSTQRQDEKASLASKWVKAAKIRKQGMMTLREEMKAAFADVLEKKQAEWARQHAEDWARLRAEVHADVARQLAEKDADVARKLAENDVEVQRQFDIIHSEVVAEKESRRAESEAQQNQLNQLERLIVSQSVEAHNAILRRHLLDYERRCFHDEYRYPEERANDAMFAREILAQGDQLYAMLVRDWELREKGNTYAHSDSPPDERLKSLWARAVHEVEVKFPGRGKDMSELLRFVTTDFTDVPVEVVAHETPMDLPPATAVPQQA